MSPEQAEKPSEVDHRADIYSLGVVFYEMLTGELPGKELQPPSRKVQIDVRLDEVVLRALEKNPERRYQQASVFKTQVETISADAGKVEVRDPKSEQAQAHVLPAATINWRRIIRRALVAGFAVWLLVVAVVSVVTFMLPESYAAQSSVILQRLVPADSSATSAAASEIDDEEMSGEVLMIQSGFILGKVVTNLNLNLEWRRRYGGGSPLQTSTTLELLKRRMVVSVARRIISIRCFDENPEAAAQLANAIAMSFIDWHAKAVASHTKNPRPKPVNGLVVAGEPKLYRVRLVEQATAPLRPSRPNRPLNIVLGILGGVVFGGLVAVFAGLISWSRGQCLLTQPKPSRQPCIWRLVMLVGGGLLLLAGFLVWLAAPKHPNYVMTGRITDAVSGEPLPQATIGVMRSGESEVLNEAKTDSDGRYKLKWPHDADLLYWRNGVRHGVELVFNISAPGYREESVGLSQTRVAGYARREFDFRLQSTNRTDALQFGPVIEQVLVSTASQAEFLDLDTGMKHSHRVLGQWELLEGKFIDWTMESGVELGFFTNEYSPAKVIELMGFNLGLHVLPELAVSVPRTTSSGGQSARAISWDKMNASQLWQEAGWVLTNHHPRIVLGTTNSMGRTYAFRTRSGNYGLLQIIGYTENPRGVKLRYKLVQNGNVSPDQTRHSPATETLVAGSISFWGLGVSQVLDIYATLARCELDVEARVRKSAATIGYTNLTALTRSEAIAQLEDAMREQAGVLVKRQSSNRLAVLYGGLEFRWVADDGDTNAPAEWQPDASDTAGKWKLRLAEELILDESAVLNAEFVANQPEQKTLALRLTEAGARRLEELTTANVNRRLAIVWRGRVLMWTKIVTPITSGFVNITGRMSDAESKRLLDALNRRPPGRPTPAPVVRSVTNTVAAKTIVLTRATNQMVGTSEETRTVTVWTDSTIQPGEALSALVKGSDGEIRDTRTTLFTHWQPDSVRTSVALIWYLGGMLGQGFGNDEAEAASAQIRDSFCERPLTLMAGEPLMLFAVTNKSGGVMTGLIEFNRAVPSAEDIAQPGGKPQAIVRVRHFVARFPSIDYSADVPDGYALRATANRGIVNTHTPAGPFQYHSSWMDASRPALPKLEPAKPGEPPPQPRAIPPKLPTTVELAAKDATLEVQLQTLQDQGPISVVLGEPKLLFSVTNRAGEPFQGFLELVGPADPVTASVQTEQAVRMLAQAPFLARVSGTTVELYAISRFQPDATNRAWWQPDGSAMSEAIRSLPGSANEPDRDLYELTFRVGEQTNGLPDTILDSIPGVGAIPAGLCGCWEAPRVADTVFHQILSCEPGLAKTSFRVGVAAGPWATLMKWDFSTGNSTGSEGTIMRTVIPGDRETSVVCSYQETKGWQTRLIALGARGEIAPIRVGPRMGVNHSFQYSATFSTEAIGGAKLHLQRRPYQWIEFHNVSLKPGQRTQVEVRDVGGD